jgi:hypothetical protein
LQKDLPLRRTMVSGELNPAALSPAPHATATMLATSKVGFNSSEMTILVFNFF